MRRREPIARFGVLAVCTGNLCRSPMIAALLAAGAPGLAVGSAGTAAARGTPWHPLAVQVLAELGTDLTGSARRLEQGDVAATPLILTAERAHIARVVHFDAAAEARTFTLLQAARLLRLEPAAGNIGPEALADHLAATLREYPHRHDDDLADPILGEIEDFRVCRARIENALPGILRALAPDRASPGPAATDADDG